jgi:hypothetical protein
VAFARRVGSPGVVVQALLELFYEGELRGAISREGLAVPIDQAGKSLHLSPRFELGMIN